MLAQRLYEAGYITYMRTDSTNLSIDAIMTCRKLILDQYGEKYLPQNPVFYASKEGAQDAHEAIRPPMFTNGVLKFHRARPAASLRSDSKLFPRLPDDLCRISELNAYCDIRSFRVEG